MEELCFLSIYLALKAIQPTCFYPIYPNSYQNYFKSRRRLKKKPKRKLKILRSVLSAGKNLKKSVNYKGISSSVRGDFMGLFREEGYEIGNVTSLTVSTVATNIPFNGTFHLHNAGTGVIYMGISSTLGSATGSWILATSEKMGPINISSANTYFLGSAAQILNFFQYIY